MRAHVVVIGAGAIGLAAALQLARAGVRGVTVVDAHRAPAMGSTSRANGGVRAQFTTPVNIDFSRFTIDELGALDRCSGGLVGYRPVGYLFLAGTPPGAAALRAAMQTQRALGVAVQELSAEEVRERVPCLRLDGLLCASFCPTDGLIDPHGVASALFAEGRRLGCSHHFGATVTGIEARGPGALVRCTETHFETEFVVNAAGPQARDVARLAGVDLPVLPYRRNLACTEALPVLPRTMPMCVDADTGLLVRREGEGALVGCSPPAAPSTETSFDPGFLDDIAQRAGNRFPFLNDAVIDMRKCWAGSYPETPDHHAIIDAPPHLPWFIQCAGFGGHGIMHCLAAGQAVAELVRDQRCATFDLTPLRLDRFDGSPVVETAVL